ncbi:MAG: cytochrome c biogenesis protein CcdA [Actinobacteria bacterium]|nr:cytochrome c biogenesis protein CcdA [Actinomycetota bacterium]
MIQENILLLSFVSGIFATFNPCGFAMLPAYLSLAILGSDTQRRRKDIVINALGFSAAMGTGVLAVFSLFALVVFPFSTAIQRYLPYVTMVMGGVLIAMGVSIACGKPIKAFTLWSPRISPNRKPITYFGYGLTFALGSISCTIGPFLAATVAALSTSDFTSILLTYVVFGLGISITIAILALITATSNQLLIKRIRNSTRKIELLSGFLLLIVGAYLLYFSWYEISLQGSPLSPNPIMDAVFRFQGTIVSGVSHILELLHILSP